MQSQHVLANPQLYKIFLDSTQEHLESIEHHVLELEQHPDSRLLIDELFRIFHTIKGDTSIVGLAAAEQVAHGIECLLDDLRGGHYQATPRIINVILTAVDFLKASGLTAGALHADALHAVLSAIAAARGQDGGQPRIEEDIAVLRVPGALDLEGTDHLAQQLLQVRDRGCSRIVVDLQQVDFICSTGLGCLAATLQDLRKQEGDLKLVHVHGDVLLKLQMTKLSDIFQLFEDEHVAINSFQ